jgi:hypothetical protein
VSAVVSPAPVDLYWFGDLMAVSFLVTSTDMWAITDDNIICALWYLAH